MIEKLLRFATIVVCACSAPQRGGDDDDSHAADAASSGPTTLAHVAAPGRLALAGGCLVIAAPTVVQCLPLDGGDVHAIANTSDRSFVRAIGDASGLIVSSVPADFGPSDQSMELDRVSFDGTLTMLATTTAGYGAGDGLAIVGDQVVFTTGGSAQLLEVPRAGGALTTLAFDSGNFGDLAVVGTTVYYINGLYIYTHDLGGPESESGAAHAIANIASETSRLATDGTRVVAEGPTLDHTGSLVVIVTPTGAPSIPALPAEPLAGAVAIADGSAWLAAGGDIMRVDLATGALATPITAQDVVDLIVAPGELYWITQQGDVRRAPR